MVDVRIVDERKNGRKMAEHGLAVSHRPFAVQTREGHQWLNVPGATYASREAAEASQLYVAAGGAVYDRRGRLLGEIEDYPRGRFVPSRFHLRQSLAFHDAVRAEVARRVAG